MSTEQEELIEALEKRIASLEKQSSRKDIWDIVSIISSFLIPLAIFFGGFYISQSQEKMQANNDQQELDLARISSDVEQAQLVAVFLDALVDTNAYKRQLAVKSLNLALHEKADELVKEIALIDPDTVVRVYANKVYSESVSQSNAPPTNASRGSSMNQLILDFFSSNVSTRKSAVQQIKNNYLTNPSLVQMLVTEANNHMGESAGDKSGIVNTLFILNLVDVAELKNEKSRVEQFIYGVDNIPGRPDTKKMLERLKSRLQ